ncbi:MAG: hypothetical protein WD063_15585 [Pirellulales bacterium]
MDASTTFGPPVGMGLAAPVLSRLGRVLAISAIGLLALTGLVICARRATGALAEPLSPGLLAGLGVVLAALAVLFRKTFVAVPLPRAAAFALWAAPSSVLVIWAAAVSLEGSGTLGLVALFGVLLLEEGYSWGRLRVKSDAATRHAKAPLDSLAPRGAAGRPGVCNAPAIESDRDEAVTQSMIRRQRETGEVIEGWLRVDFAAAQRHAAAHVAICPPMDRVPECFAEQMDGPPAAIKVAQVLACGVRFEVKLDQPAEEPASVLIEFSIQERPANSLEEEG